MARHPIHHAFVENLASTYGACIREQVRLLYRDVAKSCGVHLCPIPFISGQKKARFQMQWLALLIATGYWAARQTVPEIPAEAKLDRKFLFYLQKYVSQTIEPKLLPNQSSSELDAYLHLKTRLLRVVATTTPMYAEALAKPFLSTLLGRSQDALSSTTTAPLNKELERAFELFEKMTVIERKHNA